jgi:hypothetical protein
MNRQAALTSMTTNLSKVLWIACGLLVVAGLVLTVTAIIAARHWPFSHELAMAGIVICFSAAALLTFGPLTAALVNVTSNLPKALRVAWRLSAAAGLVLIATLFTNPVWPQYLPGAIIHLALMGIVICFFATAILTSNLSKALRIACGLLAAGGLLLIATPLLKALEDHDLAPVVAGIVVGFIATAFCLLSRCKVAQQPSTRPVIASLLGLGAILLGTVAVWGLYRCINAYLWPWQWLGMS